MYSHLYPPNQLRFHPTNLHVLYASFRGRASRGRIYAWDLRTVGSGTSNPPYHIFQTCRDTNEASKTNDINHNQKMFFDVDVRGRWMSVGDQVYLFLNFYFLVTDTCVKAGRISVFDLHPENMAAEIDHATGTEPTVSYPAFQFDAHLDAVSSVSFNPYFPVLLSTSGSRHFLDADIGETPDEGDEEENDLVQKMKRNGPITLDNSVKVWCVS